jgi:hypothetical protein
VRIFKTKWVVRYVRKERIADASLVEAVDRADRGLVDADLGGGIIKQRVARSGQGRSSGYRMLLAYRTANRAVFLYAFAKNERENIGHNELLAWREIGARWLVEEERGIGRAIKEEELEEIADGSDKDS